MDWSILLINAADRDPLLLSPDGALSHRPKAPLSPCDLGTDNAVEPRWVRRAAIDQDQPPLLADGCWSLAQAIAHHRSNGCSLEVSDLIAWEDSESSGSLLENADGCHLSSEGKIVAIS